MKNFFKNNWMIFLLVFFLVVSRFYQLDKFPVSLTHDETVYAIQAKSLALQNTNTSQNLGWFALQPIHSMYAEWPASLMAPFFWLTSNPILVAHLLPALMGVMLPFGLAWLAWGIWQDRRLSITLFSLSVFSPLLWQFGRLSFDSIFSVFFYVWAGAILLNFKGWWKLISLPILVLGFFQYQGLKLLLVPWVGSLLLLDFVVSIDKLDLKLVVKKIIDYLAKPISIVFYLSLILTFVYGFVILPSQNVNNRLSKTIFTDNQFLSEQVNTQRRLSFQNPIGSIFSNKFSQAGLFMTKNLLSAFSPKLLFIETEPQVSGFAVWSHGVFYLVDGLLILIGLFAIFHQRNTRAQGFILVLMPIIFSLPSVINTLSEWYLLRQILAYLILLILASWGVWYLWRFNQLKWMVFSLYFLSVANFIYQFYFRYPIYAADAQEVQERIIARYIDLAQQNDPMEAFTIYTPEPERYFASYLLYSDSLNEESKNLVAQAYRDEKYELGNIEFVSGCVDLTRAGVLIGDILQLPCAEDNTDEFSIYDPNLVEEKIESALSIPSVADSGEQFRIYDDQLCQQYHMKAYFAPSSLADFQVEDMTTSDFCYTWITDLRELKN